VSAGALHDLLFEYLQEGASVLQLRASMTHQGLQVQSGVSPRFPRSAFLYVRYRQGEEDVARFSDLEEGGEDAEIVDLLRIVEPRLKRISIGKRGNSSVLRADIGARRLLPIALLGDGFQRLVSMSLALFASRGGCLLVDDFENGTHYSRLTDVWTKLLTMARRTKTQIFAATHSRECLLAAHEASKDQPEDLAAKRLERTNTEIRSVRIAHAEMATALELGWEVR
jgi:hypothetical protein